MPRPIQITIPAVDIWDKGGVDFLYTLSGPLGVNLLSNIDPTINNQGVIYNPDRANMRPLLPNMTNPNLYSIPIGMSASLPTNPQLANPGLLDPFTGNASWQRNIQLKSNTNYSAVNFTLTGFDTEGQPVTEVMNGPGGFAPPYSNSSAFYFSYLSSITPSANIPALNPVTLKVFEEFQSAIIPLDYFYSNTSFSVGVNVFTYDGSPALATYTVYGTIQKPIVINAAGVPVSAPIPPLWIPLDASVDNVQTANVVYSTGDVYCAVQIGGELGNEKTEVTFTVIQQGLRF